MTYALISEVSSTDSSDITFTSLPSDYRDLIAVVSSIGTGGGFIRFNSDSSTSYERIRQAQDGAGTVSTNYILNSQNRFPDVFTGSGGYAEFWFPEFGQTYNRKIARGYAGVADASASPNHQYMTLFYNKTDAITSITFGGLTSSVSDPVTIALYGVLA